MRPESGALTGCDPIVWALRADDPLVGAVEAASYLRERDLDDLVDSLRCEILFYSEDAFLSGRHDSYFEWRVSLPGSNTNAVARPATPWWSKRSGDTCAPQHW